MRLFERDFSVLTEAEQWEWKIVQGEEVVDNNRFDFVRKNLYSKYPKAARHYMSLFPNNFLDPIDLKNENHLNELTEDYLKVLEQTNTNERSILNFISKNEAYFIIASLFKDYNFGHHEAYIFPEFMLGSSYKVDYLLIGKNSGGYEFVFVELEHPNRALP